MKPPKKIIHRESWSERMSSFASYAADMAQVTIGIKLAVIFTNDQVWRDPAGLAKWEQDNDVYDAVLYVHTGHGKDAIMGGEARDRLLFSKLAEYYYLPLPVELYAEEIARIAAKWLANLRDVYAVP